jgi:FkbM family methyltransferase
MLSRLIRLTYQLSNRLYEKNFRIYQPIYVLYKYWSDRQTLKWMAHFLKPGMTVLDIGANIGFYSKKMADLVGVHGHVHAFEAEKRNYAHLCEITAGAKNITINEIAVSAEAGRQFLQLNPDLNVDHHLGLDDGHVGYPVTVTSVDLYCAPILHVDLIKLDIQGGEYHALLGMRETCIRFTNLKIVMEYWPFGLARRGVSGSELLDLIDDMDLQITDVLGVDINRFDDTSPLDEYSQIVLSHTGN